MKQTLPAVLVNSKININKQCQDYRYYLSLRWQSSRTPVLQELSCLSNFCASSPILHCRTPTDSSARTCQIKLDSCHCLRWQWSSEYKLGQTWLPRTRAIFFTCLCKASENGEDWTFGFFREYIQKSFLIEKFNYILIWMVFSINSKAEAYFSVELSLYQSAVSLNLSQLQWPL